MNIKFKSLSACGLLTFTAWTSPAQDANTGTNSLPLTQTVKYQAALEKDRALGERALFSPGLKEKLKLTSDQRADLVPIEADFAATSREFQTANQSRIDAATGALEQARTSEEEAQIQAARQELQNVWAGLQPYRTRAITQVRPVLTPDQILILDDPENQWLEEHASEANDPSAK